MAAEESERSMLYGLTGLLDDTRQKGESGEVWLDRMRYLTADNDD